MKNSVRRIAAGLGVAGVLGAGLVLASAATASASTIPGGQLQICAQGNYDVFVHVLPEPLPGGGTSLETYSTLETPGSCWQEPVNTDGQWAQVDVVGVNPDGFQFYIGSEWYNSSVSGLGIGAEGTNTSPYLYTW